MNGDKSDDFLSILNIWNQRDSATHSTLFYPLMEILYLE